MNSLFNINLFNFPQAPGALSSLELLLSVHSMEPEEELLRKQKRLGLSTPTVAAVIP